MTQSRLVALAKQLKNVRALREVVVRGLGLRRLLTHKPSNPQELAPVGG